MSSVELASLNTVCVVKKLIISATVFEINAILCVRYAHFRGRAIVFFRTCAPGVYSFSVIYLCYILEECTGKVPGAVSECWHPIKKNKTLISNTEATVMSNSVQGSH